MIYVLCYSDRHIACHKLLDCEYSNKKVTLNREIKCFIQDLM